MSLWKKSWSNKDPKEMMMAQITLEKHLGKMLDLEADPDSNYVPHVLDAGCGYGAVAHTLIMDFGLQITGIDLLPNRLNTGSDWSQKTDIPFKQRANADYHRLPFPENSFDGVYTMETLVHAYNYEGVLQEFLRVLKPGCRLVLNEYSIPSLESVPKIARGLAERVIRNTGMTSLPHFTHGSFPKILEKAGFEKASAENISHEVHSSWYYLWWHAMDATWNEFKRGNISIDAIPGSMWIWPARQKLGYYVCVANKPK